MQIYKPDLKNKHLLDKYLAYNKYPGCELSAANNILWSSYYDTGFTIIEDMLVFCKLHEGKPVMMSFPVGNGDLKKVFEVIKAYFDENNLPFKMYLVQDEMFELIENWYPGEYEIKYSRGEADYLYLRETLENLAGKKLHGKRNHINRFLENYPDYEYEVINEDNYFECIQLSEDWEKQNNPDNEEDKNYEIEALTYALKNRDALGLKGALIRVGGKVVAFTLGEPLTKDTFVIHFEKAYSDIQGAYPMINREFVRRELGEYTYVNREEDMDIPGLRHAKTSYQPIRLVEKGLVTKKEV